MSSDRLYARAMARLVMAHWFAELREDAEDEMRNPWEFDDEPPGKGNGDDEPPTPRVPVRCPKCRKWAQARVRDGAVYCGNCDQAFHPNFLDFLSGPTADDPPNGG